MDTTKRLPLSTYRIQFNSNFTFKSCTEIVEYLASLGISHVYASPIFKARPGSTHGYDICDDNSLNPELGSTEEFSELIQQLQENGIGWIQDIVPNHMAFDPANKMLADVLENGQDSVYGKFFDVTWDHPYENLRGKILLPFLGTTYGSSLEAGDLALKMDEKGLFIGCYGKRFPVQPETYAEVFSGCTDKLKAELHEDNPILVKFIGALLSFQKPAKQILPEERNATISMARTILRDLYIESNLVRTAMDEAIAGFNGSMENPKGYERFDELHASQFFRLAFWKVASEELNYRRFFTISDLIGVRVEIPEVFDSINTMIFDMLDKGIVQGLRIDHIDGLYDPLEYLKRIRMRFPETFIVCEKILSRNETLPEQWPVQGTTGYEFLSAVNTLFIRSDSQQAFDKIYAEFTERIFSFDDLVVEKKRVIIEKYMAGDIDNCALLLKRIAGKDRMGSDITMYALRRAIVELLAYFPVYRTYINPDNIAERDRAYLTQAITKAQMKNPSLINELHFINKFLIQTGESAEHDQRPSDRLGFIMRLQQFSGALMAKGFEDTVFYNYNRLISLNEVGGDPGRFGDKNESFHDFCKFRQEHWPSSFNSTETHDTKQGADTRARINVLSEIPTEWSKQVRKWRSMNRGFVKIIDDKPVPDANVEYMLYQTLVGSFPFDQNALASYPGRVRGYALKAVREAKENSNWIKFDSDYEGGIAEFITAILDNDPSNKFLADFIPFQRKIAWYGIFNSLSQTALKLTTPGIPDCYQGAETWDLNLVDPDNRRQVDFANRKIALDAIVAREGGDLQALVKDLLTSMTNGHVKMYLYHRSLNLRKTKHDVFEKGQYLPLSFKGSHKNSVVGFVKKYAGSCIAVVVPRFLTGFVPEGRLPLGRDLWRDTAMSMPSEAMPSSWRNILTNETVPGVSNTLVGDLFSSFPLAILEA